MNMKLIGIFVILFTIYQIGFGLKCWNLIDKIESLECNSTLASITYDNLDAAFVLPALNESVDTYNCVNLELNSLPLDARLKGCIFSDIKVCELKKKLQKFNVINCNQCNGDNCNPAGRAVSQIGIIGVSAIIAVISKIIL